MAVYWSPGTRIDYNGLSFNTGNKPKWICTSVSGLGSPAARFESGERVAQHGSWGTKAYLGTRSLELSGVHVTHSAAEGDAAMNELVQACSLEDRPLTLYLASGPVTAMVRRSGDVKYERIRPGYHRWSLSVIALDPRLYVAGSAWERSTGLQVTTGGLTVPITPPFLINSSSTNDQLVFENPYPGGKVTYKLEGAIDTPSIWVTNSLGTRQLRWNLTLAEGEWLDIDPENKTSLLQGLSQRSPVVREWSELVTGTNSFKLRAVSYSPSAKLTVYVKPSM